MKEYVNLCLWNTNVHDINAVPSFPSRQTRNIRLATNNVLYKSLIVLFFPDGGTSQYTTLHIRNCMIHQQVTPKPSCIALSGNALLPNHLRLAPSP